MHKIFNYLFIMRKAPANHTIYFASTTQLRSSKNYDLECLDHDTTGFYEPSMAHNALPMRPCMGVVVFFVCNSTDSKQLRICGQGQKPRLRWVLSLITFYFYMCICCSLHSLICLLARTDASKSHHTGYTSSALHFPVYSSA